MPGKKKAVITKKNDVFSDSDSDENYKMKDESKKKKDDLQLIISSHKYNTQLNNLVSLLQKELTQVHKSHESFNESFNKLELFSSESIIKIDNDIKIKEEEIYDRYNKVAKEYNEKEYQLQTNYNKKVYDLEYQYKMKKDDVEQEFKNHELEKATTVIKQHKKMVLENEVYGKMTKDRKKYMDAYNEYDNRYGDKIKIIMISPAGSEGLDLKNVRQVHILEPYWNETRIEQLIGRAIRYCGHKDLPMKERQVDIFRYKSTRPNKDTTDEAIENLSRSKQGLLQSFFEAMEEVSIDCELFKSHNMINKNYKCFQFNQNALFDKQIGPAYKTNIYDDMNIDNGLNSKNAIVQKVKVLKTKGVILESNEKDKPKYSNKINILYDEDTHIVYDVEYHYPLGKVSIDKQNLPIKLDENTYIIDKIIPVPKI
jgi:hypothetical protein